MPNSLGTDFSILTEVTFIAKDDYYCFFLAIVLAEVYPLVQILEAALIWMGWELLVRSKTTKATKASLR